MYEQLIAYKKVHGDCKIPQKDPTLGQWAKHQRNFYRTQTLTQEHKFLLNSVGFQWGALPRATAPSCASWEAMLQRLIEYKTVHGDCKVPQHYNKDPQLGRWVNNQRSAYKRNDMLEERKCILNSIGFVLNAMNAKPSGTKRVTWEEMFQRLIAYKMVHGDCKVPQHYDKDPQLGSWVNNQRSAYKRNDVSEERKRLLNSIGFSLNALPPGTKRVVWEEMYRRLVAYKTVHKDTNVPRRYDVDPQLGNWVSTQRYRVNKMKGERKQLLNSIGFAWEGIDKIRQHIYNKNVFGV